MCVLEILRQMSKMLMLMLMTIMMIAAVKPCALSQSLDRCLRKEELMLMTIITIAAVKLSSL